MNAVATSINLFLPIQWQMVAVFADQHLREQTRRGQPAFLQTFGQRGNHRSQVQFRAVNIFFADRPAAQKTRRFIIQLLAHFLPDATPVLRRGFHGCGFNHFFDHWQVIGQARRTVFAGTTAGDFWWFNDRDHGIGFHQSGQL